MENSNEQFQGQTKKCPKCQEDIQLDAKKCKHCGADLRNWFVRHKIITGILILFVIGIISSVMDSNETKNTSDNSSTISNSQETAKTKEQLTEQSAEQTTEKMKQLTEQSTETAKQTTETAKQTTETAEQSTERPAEETAKTVEKTEEELQQEENESILNQLWNAADKSIKNRKNLDIRYNQNQKRATIIYQPESVWDGNETVRKAYSYLVKYGQEAFKIQNVKIVETIIKTEFINEYGKTNVRKAVVFSMKKDEFQKYNWEELEYKPIFDQINRSVIKNRIHPAIQKELEKEELYLSL